MPRIIKSIGTVISLETTKTERTVANVQFGRSTDGFASIDSVFIPKGKAILAGCEYLFNLALNKAGDVVTDADGVPMEDENGVRTFKTDAIFALNNKFVPIGSSAPIADDDETHED